MVDPILRQLDQAAEDYSFPGPPNMNYPTAGVRLDAFAGDTEGLLAFQVLRYSRPDEEFEDGIFLFGDRVEEPGLQPEDVIADDIPTGDPLRFTVSLRGQAREVTATSADYAAAGVRERNLVEPQLDIVRLLAYKYADELFLSPPKLLRHIGKEGLQHLFRLDGWRRPDLGKQERPSRMPCFRDLVTALHEKARTPPQSCGKGINTQWTRWIDEE